MVRAVGLSTVLMLIASCDHLTGLPQDGRPVTDVYAAGAERDLRLRERPSPLRAERTIPVLSPPEVFAVYVPSHVDRERDLLIGEHWIFFKMRDAEWFIEREEEGGPPATGPAREEDWKRLTELTEDKWNRLLVPHD